MVIAEIEPDKPLVKTADKPGKSSKASAAQSIGLVISDLTDAARKELKIKGGVQVDSAADAAALRAGLHEGDVIMAVANTPANVKDFETVLAGLDKSKPIIVLFRRGEWSQLHGDSPQQMRAGVVLNCG